MKELVTEMRAWWETNEECRRAKSKWLYLSKKYLDEVHDQLSEKEKLHLRHTVFRINGLMYLYAQLRRTEHNTYLGVVSGMITHLLDYFYDYCSPNSDQIAEMERVIYLQEQPSEDDPLQVALYKLSQVTWSLTPNPATVKQTLNNMLSTQKQSMVQMHPHVQVSENDLAQLTVNKGHRSLCLYFSIANPEFDVEEAASLMSFGHYMQFMDDLEDFYEDQDEGRNSTVSSVSENQKKATKLLRVAEADLARFYNNDNYDYRFVRDKLLFFHNAMLFAFRIRELTRHFPKPVQRAIQNVRELLSLLIPFFYVAPVEYTE